MAEAERAGGVQGDLEKELTCSVSLRFKFRDGAHVGEAVCDKGCNGKQKCVEGK